MDKTLKAVKDMGYDYVEFAGYFGKTAEEVKSILDKYGLEAVSVHHRHYRRHFDAGGSGRGIKRKL